MSEMVERVARAMAAKDSGPEGSKLFDIHWREFGAGYLDSARAAIKVMREPSEAMLKAMYEDMFQESLAGLPTELEMLRSLYSAGIDAALEGEGR